ncbi:MAG: hypothetical protein ABW217_01900 [Polyangiaceae bacterium]
MGFNNNVRHRDRIFHIQTEDSGVRRPHINTHLFVDGGRIIKSMRTDYSAELGAADLADVVRQLMKKQHKAMFVALRAGALDPIIDQLGDCGQAEPLPRGVDLGAGPANEASATPSPVSQVATSTPEAATHDAAADVSETPVSAAVPVHRLTPVPPPLPHAERRILTPVPPPVRSPTPSLSARSNPVVPPPLTAAELHAHTGSPYLYVAGVPAGEVPPPSAGRNLEVPSPRRPPKSSGARRLGRPALSEAKPNAQTLFGVPESSREQTLDDAIQTYIEGTPLDPAAK